MKITYVFNDLFDKEYKYIKLTEKTYETNFKEMRFHILKTVNEYFLYYRIYTYLYNDLIHYN